MPPADPQPVRRSVRAWVLAAAGLCVLPAAHGPLEASPAADVLAVGAQAEPCLSVRERPSRRSRIVDCLDAGTRVTLTGSRGTWTRVQSEGGVMGWVDGDLLVAPKAAPPGAAGPRTTPVSPEPERPAPPEVPPAAAARPPAPDPAPAASEPEASAEPEAPTPPAARKAPVRIVVASDPGTGAPTAAPVERTAEKRAAETGAERDRLAERALLAEQRAAMLEAELAAAREARDAGATDSGDLGARVEELTRERDDLAHRLAQVEARLLYVLSDLERTRAELMQLKGIPAALVQPASEPEPAAATPEPEPVPPAPAEPQEPATPETPAFVRVDEVVGTVRAWAQAWSDQRADDYLAFYSGSFAPPGGESRDLWAARRRERIRAPRSIEVTLDRINPIVSGDRARVMFVQSYASDSFSDTVNKTLVLERVAAGTWQIVEELVE